MLLEEFSTIFDRPEKVKKLREYILSLAVRGKLVKQDEHDEPVSVLLERIREEKDRLVKEKKIKKEKSLPDISEDEIPYELPKGWEWVRLGEIGDWGAGATPSRGNSEYYDNGTINWLKTGELNDGYINSAEEMITELALSKCSLRLNKPGDILIAMYGATIGKLGILNIEATTNQACCGCTVYDGIYNRYLFNLLLAMRETFRNQGAGGAQPNISRQKIINTIAPLPPLNEQKRIVEKLDYLMEFCDKLEEQLEKQVKYGSLSAKSVLNGVSNCSSYEELEEALRFIIENFKDLTLADGAIGELKNAILSLAVKGKLVPQYESDEPASVLIERIREEKDRLVKAKKIKKEKSLPEISEDEIPYELPNSWEWVRLGEGTLVIMGQSPSSDTYNENKQGLPFYQGKSDFGTIYPTPRKWCSKPSKVAINKDILISVRAPIGPTNLCKEDSCIGRGLSAIRPLCKTEPFYILYTMRAFESILADKGVGSTFTAINSKDLNNFMIPLPPLNEQKRIVDKVDRLMKVCDELELRIEESKKYNEKLMESILKESLKA